MIQTHPNKNVRSLPPNHIFVFGSNLQGKHGKGAAKAAVIYFGAIYGQAYGLQNRAFAIPTRTRINKDFVSLSLEEIKPYADKFLMFASTHPELTFFLTPIGTGLAGHSHEAISSLFDYFPSNVIFPETFIQQI